MSPRDWQERIRDILDAISEVKAFTADLDRAGFLADTRT
jgi:uncharacterized protein with HEPN domain